MIPARAFRKYAREGLLLSIRFWVFALAQSAFFVIAADETYAAGEGSLIMDTLALTACCCLVLSLWSVAWEACSRCCCATPPIFTKTAGRPSSSSSSSFFSCCWCSSSEKEDAWLLRGQSMACGACMFVIAYSIHGMAWLPQVSMAAAAVLCSFLFCGASAIATTKKKDSIIIITTTTLLTENADEPQPRRRSRKGAAFAVLIAVGLLTVNGFLEKPQQWTPHNVWLGFVLPSASAVALCRCSLLAARHGIHADRVMALAMPSVGIVSLTFLSLYVPSFAVVPLKNQSAAGFFNAITSASASWEACYRALVMSSAGQTRNNASAADALYEMFIMWPNSSSSSPQNNNNSLVGWFWHDFWMNQTAAVAAPFDMMRPRGTAATLALVAAPMLLWGELTVFLAGFFRGRSQSTLGVWLLAMTATQMWWHGGATPPLIAVLVLVNLALLVCILPDEMRMRDDDDAAVLLFSIEEDIDDDDDDLPLQQARHGIFCGQTKKHQDDDDEAQLVPMMMMQRASAHTEQLAGCCNNDNNNNDAGKNNAKDVGDDDDTRAEAAAAR